MSQISIDASTCEKLRSSQGIVDLIDEEGRIIGTFRPVHQPPYDPALIPDIDPAERERRASEPDGLTTKEVLDRLEKL